MWLGPPLRLKKTTARAVFRVAALREPMVSAFSNWEAPAAAELTEVVAAEPEV